MANKRRVTTVEEIEDPIDTVTPDTAPDTSVVASDTNPTDDTRVRDEQGRFIPKDESKAEDKPEIDIEKIKEDVAARTKDEVTKEVTDRIRKSLGGDEQEEKLDEYAEFQKGVWEKEGRAPTWTEALQFLKGSLRSELQKEQEQAQKTVAEQEEAEKTRKEAFVKQYNAKIDADLNDLYTSNRLPKIQDKDNPQDFGVVARRALFQTMLDVNNQRNAQNLPLLSVKEVFYEHFKMPSTQGPAGYDAPVSMGRGAAQTTGQDEMPYHELHRKSFTDIINGR